jgi:hypothetical protein
LKTDGIPFIGNLIQPGLTALFIGFSVLFTTETVQHYLFKQLVTFWTEGCFGFQWLGKLYFLLSVGLSLAITYRYGFFEEGTFSHTLLRLLLRSLGGVMMLLQCSPNLDICIALGIAALLRDHILDLGHYLWITLEASRQTPSYLYSTQQPLTTDAYTHQGQVHTAAALKELRDYLQTPEGKAQSAKINWKWREANRDDLSSKLEHFTKGLYSGRPSSPEGEEEDLFGEDNEAKEGPPPARRRSWSRSLFTLLFYALVCLGASVMVGVVVFDVGTGAAAGERERQAEWGQSFLSAGRALLEDLGVLLRQETSSREEL